MVSLGAEGTEGTSFKFKASWFEFLDLGPRARRFLTRSRRMSSGRFRAFLHTPLAAEWEKITGAWDTSKARRAVASETWDKSTIIPKRFISVTTFCEGRLGGGLRGYIHACISHSGKGYMQGT